MKPIRLEIEGFFSYTTRQVLDFQRLWEAGLFGLIGETGAGKSALIEAILIALYADSARSARTPKNLVNPLATDKLSFIELTFEHKGQLYTARYEINRGRITHVLNLPTDTQRRGSEVSAYITNELLGLSYEDFTLAFVLQQGQFDAFLSKSPKDRATVLQRILRLPLDKLNEQTGNLFRDTEAKLIPLQNEIERLRKELSENDPPELDKKYKETQAELNKVEAQIRDIDEFLRVQEGFKSYAEQLKEQTSKYQQLKAQEPEYHKRKKLVEKIENVKLSDLNRLHAEEKVLRQEIEELRAKVEQIRKEIQNYQEKIAILHPKVEKTEPDYERRSELEQRRKALQELVIYWQMEKAVAELHENLRSEEQHIEKKKESIKLLESQVIEREEKRETLQKQLERWPIDLLQWYATREHLMKALSHAEELYKEKESALKTARTAAESELLSLSQKAGIPSPLPTQLEDWEKFLEQLEEKIQRDIERLKYEHLAATLAATLEPHQACPVCGSTEHPHKAQPDPLFQKHLTTLENLQKSLRNFRSKTFMLLSNQVTEHREALNAHKKAQEDVEAHDKSFKPEWAAWGHRPSTSVAQFSAERQKLEKKLQDLDRQLNELRKQRKEKQEDLEKHEQDLKTIKEEYDRKAREANAMKALLERALTEADLQLSEEAISNEVRGLEERLKAVEAFKNWKNDLEEAKTKSTVAQEELHKKILDLSAKEQKLESLKKEENQKAADLGLSLEEALKYLEYPEEEFRMERSKVEKFFTEMTNLCKSIEDIRPKAEKFDKQQYDAKKEEKIRLEDKKSKLLLLLGELQNRIIKAQKDVDRLKMLEKEAKLLKEEVEGLEKIKKLLRGEGFTQYVLSEVLRELLVPASEYLRQWSRGQLELVAGKGELELKVRDHLAGGHLRDIETLSGGQRFQAALALALTLSDLVRRRSGTTEHLSGLIIDEGFGTLDAETLQTVVQTLREIATEKGRPIGIITHRAEIQTMLPAYARIERQGESSVVKID